MQSEAYGVNQANNVLEKISKITYEYDAGNFSDTSLQQSISPIQHDTTNYGASFVIGRANLTSTTRHEVPVNNSLVTSIVRYNTAGNPVASLDPLGRQSKIIYADSFNDGNNNRNTFAYPTKLIDAAGNFSEVKYRFDIGANVWAQSPTPYGTNNNIGKTTARIYDALGRLEKETLVNSISGAYTRYEYPANGVQSKVFSTVIDTNSNGADASDEVYAESWADGAGRTLRSRTEHPGSAGGWSGSLVEYDTLGRVKRSTVPTEISVSGTTWTPAGDDARYDANNNLVWLWTSAEYDWKSRVTREINTDGTDRLYSYEGCGCAGGQVTTVQSELVPRDDQPLVNARRKQKIYADVLGRTWKTEVLNWDGITPYTTTVQGFNGRDQVFKTRQYAGATSGSTYQTVSSSAAYQDVSMSYDGHGRMKTRHYPIEDNLTETSWIYNSDDSIQQVIDPRGAITNFTYEAERGLLTNINYSVPSGSNIPVTPAVNFTYDALGNRTKTDTVGVSEINYNYDELSRLTSEMVDFDDLTENFTIGYTYHLGGTLKSITDPLNSTINYTNDKTGRLSAVTGDPWGDNTTGNYASGIKHRSFGGIKQIDYTLPDETSQIKMEYDNRQRVSHSSVATNKVTGGYLLKADFS